MDKKDYKVIFDRIVEDLVNYLCNNKLKSMVLGISGGIDSTVCAAICHEASKKTGIPLIGRSLPIKNKTDEISIASIVGNAFCNDFAEVNITEMYDKVSSDIMFFEQDKFKDKWTTTIASGNIQARLRMIYLYHLAGISGGMVIDTDNKSENGLAFFTLHGDVGDYKPIGALWKTEVYKLAEYLTEKYKYNSDMKVIGVQKSIELTPTDGLGISSSDLEQIGANSYEEVDNILQIVELYRKRMDCDADIAVKMVMDVVDEHENLIGIDNDIIAKVCERYKKGEFKRLPSPIADIKDKLIWRAVASE